MRRFLGVGVLMACAAAAHADTSETINLYSLNADPEIAVVAVQASFAVEPGKAVRLSVYDSAEGFLENARTKLEAPLDEHGVALLPLESLEPGAYAFAAYLDVNGDGKLNRGALLGIPKEPVAFSNGVKIKMRKPRFDETKVDVRPGSVVVITLED